jgi:hypothetical protein
MEPNHNVPNAKLFIIVVDYARRQIGRSIKRFAAKIYLLITSLAFMAENFGQHDLSMRYKQDFVDRLEQSSRFKVTQSTISNGGRGCFANYADRAGDEISLLGFTGDFECVNFTNDPVQFP